MTSGLEIEQQIAELPARLLKAGYIAALFAIPDDLHHVDEFGAVFIARLVELGLRLGDQGGEVGPPSEFRSCRLTAPGSPSASSASNRSVIRWRALCNSFLS